MWCGFSSISCTVLEFELSILPGPINLRNTYSFKKKPWSITLSHAMRPGLIRHFWVANRAGPENDNKFKERVLKKQY
jgi:hypothetical protein